jgi:hypothetical protein
MPPQALTQCLVGMSPSDWYQLLNSRVFFWLDPHRLNRQRAACEPRPQIVLVVETARLLSEHVETAALSPINTGNARRRPALRGASTFMPYTVWSVSGWSSQAERLTTRPRMPRSPVELTVTGAVPEIMNMIVGVCWLGPGEWFSAEQSVETRVKRKEKTRP